MNLQLFIKNSCCIDVTPTDTIIAIKKRYNIPDFIKLYHRTILEDHYTIEHYNLSNNDTIQFSSGLAGGIPTAETTAAPGLALDTTVAVKEQVNFMTKTIRKIAEFSKTMMQKISEAAMRAKDFAISMKTAAQFFPMITLVLIVLAFFAAPMKFLLLIFGLIVVTILYVIYAVLNLPPFIYIVAAIWFLIMDIVPLILFCIIYAGILFLIFIGCLILAGLNFISSNSLKDVVLCDNSPGTWYKVANSHLGNKWERGIFCSRPCFSIYAPDTTGTNCVRIPKGYPPYCPQAEIMRIYATKKADSKYKFDNYNDKGNLAYMGKKPIEREIMLKNYYLRKRNFMNICNKEMADYNNITLNICASVDSIKDLQPRDKERLKQVCQQAFCTSDKNYPFCAKISELKEDDQNALIKKIITILVIIIVFCLVILFTLKNLYEK
jgi:hypothetical protein